jgi:hypothetical protein
MPVYRFLGALHIAEPQNGVEGAAYYAAGGLDATRSPYT